MNTLWPLTALFGEVQFAAPGAQPTAYDETEIEAAFAALIPGAMVPELDPAAQAGADVDAAFAALFASRSAS